MATNNSNKNLVSLTYNDDEIKENILNNLLLMLIERKTIDKNDHNKHYESLLKNFNEYNESYIKINKDLTIKIKFVPYKLTTIRKIADIENFLNDQPKEGSINYKFIIVSNILNKALKQLLEYKNTEVFLDYELKINLIDHVLVPKHIVLSKEEADELIESYNIKTKDLKRMLVTDPVAKYYNLKKNDIVRIERPSINSGIAIDYRIVF